MLRKYSVMPTKPAEERIANGKGHQGKRYPWWVIPCEISTPALAFQKGKGVPNACFPKPTKEYQTLYPDKVCPLFLVLQFILDLITFLVTSRIVYTL